MAQQHKPSTAKQPVAGQWARQQRTWVEKDQQKSEHAARLQQSSADGAGATDDDPTDGEWAEKRREKMQRQEKAEGERRD